MDLYNRVFVEDGRVDYAIDVLDCFTPIAAYRHWFCLPEMGHLIATVYNVAMVVLSPALSMTYLPLRTGPSTEPKIICIGLINANHFIEVFNPLLLKR